MKGSTGGLTLAQIWDELVTKAKNRLVFHDEFNRAAMDAEIWTPTLDGTGSWQVYPSSDDYPTTWRLRTGNVIDNDSVIHGMGPGNLKNRFFTPFEEDKTLVTWITKLLFNSVADISAFWGLLNAATVAYAQNMTRCAHFFADVAVNVNFNARTHEAAEEVTDTGVALDTNFHDFKIVVGRTSVLFYIDDVLVATHVTQVPPRPIASHFLLRTEAAATKGMFIDKLDVIVS